MYFEAFFKPLAVVRTGKDVASRVKGVSCIVLSLLMATLAGCGEGGGSGVQKPANRIASDVTIPFALSGAFSEGIASDPDTGDLYVGTDTGAPQLILKAGAQDKTFGAWLPFSALGVSASSNWYVMGLRIRQGTLYACVVNTGISAAILAVQLKDASKVGFFNLPQTSDACNDLTLDDAGNLFVTAYVNHGQGTNSVYKLSADKVRNGGTLLGSDWIEWSSSSDSVNGLVYDSANSKLIWKKGDDVVSSPTAGDAAVITKEFTVLDNMMDGMQLTTKSNLLVINGGAYIYSMSSPNKGKATAVSDGANCQTTVAIYGDDAFCVNSPAQAQGADSKVLRLKGAANL